MNEPRETIIIDAGNSHTKAQRLALEGDNRRVSFKSVVADLGIDVPDVPEKRNPEEGDGFIFHFEGRWWAVGNVAERKNGIAVRGGKRYESQNWKVLVAAAVAALVEESASINLLIASPLRGGEAAERAIKTNLTATFTVRLYDPQRRGNEGQRTIKAQQVDTMHETEGAYFYYLLDDQGNPRPDAYFASLHRECKAGMDDLFKYGLILVDGGGWTVDTLPVNGLHPDFARALTLRGQIGIQNVLIWLEDALQAHPKVGGGSAWQPHVLEGALIPTDTTAKKAHFKIRFGRQDVDVTDCVEQATRPLVDDIAEYIIEGLNAGRDNNFVLLTGGSAQAAYPWLGRALADTATKRGVENHTLVMRPDTETPPYYHNVEGMARYVRRKRNRLQQGQEK